VHENSAAPRCNAVQRYRFFAKLRRIAITRGRAALGLPMLKDRKAQIAIELRIAVVDRGTYGMEE
jgi:hypothetical protein